jgi:hypothetical protein
MRPSAEQLIDELCVMYYIISSAELWVFIFECIETMRAASNDFFYFISIEHCNILHCHHLETEIHFRHV